MFIGLMWFDNDRDKSITDKVRGALEYYRRSYGRPANIVYVHPTMLEGETLVIDSVVVSKNRSVLPNHFWVGEARQSDMEA